MRTWRQPAPPPKYCLCIDWFHNRFSPAATSWGHSKCRGRLARDGPSPRVAAVRLGPWVQSEAPRLSLGRGGEPRAHSVPRSRIFPRPHSSDIANTTLPHALTLLLLGYSSETWWQSRLASSTRRFAQVSRQALPPLAASPARSRSPQIQCARILRPARTPTPPPPLMRPQRRAATCAPHATARSDAYPSAVARRLTHITLVILCRRRLALPCAMALGDGRMLGGEQAASCMEYGVVSASTMACHAARHTLCVASKPRRLSDS